MRRICCILLGLWLGTSCLNDTNRTSRQAPVLYADYRISGEEGRDEVTCLFRFYRGNPDGETVVLPPGGIVLDGQPLAADSAPQTGHFYERSLPLQEFAGNHTVTLQDGSGRTYREAFEYRPFYIVPELEPSLQRGPITIGIEGLRSGAALRVILTDTSFATPDVNELVPVVDGKLTISPLQLDNVSSGPLNLHLFKEEERPLRNPPAGGGMLSISYSLQRVFQLTDP